MNLTGKLGSTNLSISTIIKKVESSNTITINANNYKSLDV